MTDIKSAIEEQVGTKLTAEEQKELNSILKEASAEKNSRLNNIIKGQSSSTTKTSSNNNALSKEDNKTKKINPLSKLLQFDFNRLTGIYPIMINPNKLFALFKDKDPQITPDNSFYKIGEYVNKYNGDKQINTNNNKIAKLRLDNDFNTTLDVIRLFADNQSNLLTPKSFINCINSLILKYKDNQRKDLIYHMAYLAEVIYQHFSTLISNETIERDYFFNNNDGLDIEAVRECSEFFYTDYLFLNSDEKKELDNIINSYYLEKSKTEKETNKKNSNKSQIKTSLEEKPATV